MMIADEQRESSPADGDENNPFSLKVELAGIGKVSVVVTFLSYVKKTLITQEVMDFTSTL